MFLVFLFSSFLFPLSASIFLFFFFSSRRRHTRWPPDWSSDVCSSDLPEVGAHGPVVTRWEVTPLEERLTRVRHVPIPYSSQDLRARPGDVRRAPRGYRAARSWGGGAASTGPLPLGG